MLSAEIAAYLITQNPVGGVTLTTSAPANLYTVPLTEDAPDPCVSVLAISAEESEYTFGPSLQAPANERQIFAVMTRAARDGAVAAETLALAVHKWLRNLGPVTLSGVIYRKVRDLAGPPRFLSLDGIERPRYVCTYLADKDES